MPADPKRPNAQRPFLSSPNTGQRQQYENIRSEEIEQEWEFLMVRSAHLQDVYSHPNFAYLAQAQKQALEARMREVDRRRRAQRVPPAPKVETKEIIDLTMD